jgi:2-keto-4-pentenoate hydratase
VFEADVLGAELFEAAEAATPVALLTDRFPDLTWEQARAVARATDDIRRTRGQIPIGYKLGWTSTAMREALGELGTVALAAQ